MLLAVAGSLAAQNRHEGGALLVRTHGAALSGEDPERYPDPFGLAGFWRMTIGGPGFWQGPSARLGLGWWEISAAGVPRPADPAAAGAWSVLSLQGDWVAGWAWQVGDWRLDLAGGGGLDLAVPLMSRSGSYGEALSSFYDLGRFLILSGVFRAGRPLSNGLILTIEGLITWPPSNVWDGDSPFLHRLKLGLGIGLGR